MVEEKDKKTEKKKKTKTERPKLDERAEKSPLSSSAVKPAARPQRPNAAAASEVKPVSKKIPADPLRSRESEARKHPVVEELKQKIRIKIRAYDNKVADSSIKQIVEIAERYGAEVIGPVPLPTEIRKYTVNRSTFVHKNAREQFEMRVHKRLLDIINPTAKAIDSLMNLNLPAGVDIEVKM